MIKTTRSRQLTHTYVLGDFEPADSRSIIPNWPPTGPLMPYTRFYQAPDDLTYHQSKLVAGTDIC